MAEYFQGKTRSITREAKAEWIAKNTNVALGSDAFFPFADNIEEIAAAGIKAIIQPGGSVRDQESIDAANKHGLTMIFTGVRHFRH